MTLLSNVRHFEKSLCKLKNLSRRRGYLELENELNQLRSLHSSRQLNTQKVR